MDETLLQGTLSGTTTSKTKKPSVKLRQSIIDMMERRKDPGFVKYAHYAMGYSPEEIEKELGYYSQYTGQQGGGGQQNLSDIGKAVMENPGLLKDLTPTERTAIIPELNSAGFKFGGGSATSGLDAETKKMADTMITARKLLTPLLEKEEIEGVGGLGSGSAQAFLAKNLGYGTEEGETNRNIIANAKASIAKLRGGTSFTPNEEKLLDAYTPSINDSDLVVKTKIKNLNSFIDSYFNVATGKSLSEFEQKEKEMETAQTQRTAPWSPEDDQEALEWAKANPNDPRAQQIYSFLGQPAEVKSATSGVSTADEKGNIKNETFGDKITEFFEVVGDSWKERKGKIKSSGERYMDSEQTGAETLFQQFSQAPAFLGDILFSGIKAVASDKLEKGTAEQFEKIAPAIQPIMEKYTEWAKQNPRAAANFEAAMNMAEIIPINKGVGLAEKGVRRATNYAIKETPKILDDTAKLTKTLVKPSGAFEKNVRALETITKGNQPLKRFVEAQRLKGIDVQSMLAKSDVLDGTVDSNGKITTLGKDGAVERFYKKEIEGTDRIIRDRLASGEEKVSLEKLKKSMLDEINKSRIAGSSKTSAIEAVEREIKGLELDAKDGFVPLEKVYDAKITLNKTIDYNNSEKALIQKDIARILKETVENNVKDLEVKKISRTLQEKYAVQEFLEKLDGKIVEGGRLGKYFSGTVGAGIGAAAGSSFGPVGASLGAAVGAKVGGALKGKMMKKTFKSGLPKESFQPKSKLFNMAKDGKISAGMSIKDISKKGSPSMGQIDLAEEAKKYKSAEEFVKAQGTPVYHGTAGKFDTFDDKMKGSVTGAKSAHGATWFTDDKDVAKAYSVYAAETGPVNKIMRQVEEIEKIAQKSGKQSDWDKYDKLVQEMEALDTYDANFERRKLANVKEAVVKGDFYTVDAKRKTPQELSADGDIDSWLNSQVEKAKKLGKDGLIIKNIDDAVGLYDKPSTHYAIFDSSKIKTKSQLTDIWNKSQPLQEGVKARKKRR